MPLVQICDAFSQVMQNVKTIQNSKLSISLLQDATRKYSLAAGAISEGKKRAN
ncbi:hypothetical protein [Nostoc sp.]